MKDYITGIWTAGKNRIRDELDLLSKELSSSGRNEYSERIAAMKGRINDSGDLLPKEEKEKLLSSMPTYGNAALRSFTSKGSLYAAGIGAGIGGAYGAMSQDSGIMSNALTMGALGYAGKGIIGMSGERASLMNTSGDILLNSI